MDCIVSATHIGGGEGLVDRPGGDVVTFHQDQKIMDGVSKQLSSLQTTVLRRQSTESNSPFLPTPRSLSGLSNTDSDRDSTPTEENFNPIASVLRRTTRVPLYVHPFYWTHIHRNVLLSLNADDIEPLDLDANYNYPPCDDSTKEDTPKKIFEDNCDDNDDNDEDDGEAYEEAEEEAAAKAQGVHIPRPSIIQYDRTEAVTEFEAGPSYSLPSMDDSLCSILKSALWSLSDDGNHNVEHGTTKNPSIFLEDEDAVWNRGCPPTLDFSFHGDDASLPVDAVLKLRYPFHFEDLPVLAVVDRSEHMDRRYRFRKRDRSKKKVPWPETHRWDVPFDGVETLDPYFLAVLLALAQSQRVIADEHGQEMDCYSTHVVFPYTWIPPAPPAPPVPPRTSHPPCALRQKDLPPPPPLSTNPLLPADAQPFGRPIPPPRTRVRSNRLPPESSPYPFHSCRIVTVSAKISDSYLDLLTKPPSPSTDSPTSLPYPYPSLTDSMDFRDDEPYFKISIKTHTLLSSENRGLCDAFLSTPSIFSQQLGTSQVPLVEEKELLKHLHGLVTREAGRWMLEGGMEPLLMGEGFATPPASDDGKDKDETKSGDNTVQQSGCNSSSRKESAEEALQRKRRRQSGLVGEGDRVKLARIMDGSFF